MALRDEANKRKWAPATLAVVLLGVASTALYLELHQSSPGGPVKVYYYDLTNDALFVHVGQNPPIVGPSGDKGDGDGTAVYAHVMSCGDCANDSDRFVGYLENTSAAYRQMLHAGARPGPLMGHREAGGGMEVADPADKKTWVGKGTPEGKDIMDRANAKCGEGKPAQVCSPPPGA